LKNSSAYELLTHPVYRRFSHKNPKMFDFRFNTPTPSLNQGQGEAFSRFGNARNRFFA